jgi:hypothetical protein
MIELSLLIVNVVIAGIIISAICSKRIRLLYICISPGTPEHLERITASIINDRILTLNME